MLTGAAGVGHTRTAVLSLKFSAEFCVREKHKLSSQAKWTHWELSTAVVLSGLSSSRQNYLKRAANQIDQL